MDRSENFTGCTVSSYHCDCFAKLTEEELSLLESKSVMVHYRKGENICKQGSFATHIMYISRGLAKVYLNDGINTLVLKLVPECNLLGLSSINENNTTFQYSASAYIDTDVRQIDIGFFRELVGNNAAFAKEMINILSMNSIQINGRFFCLTHKQSFGRMADILLCLSDRIFKKKGFDLVLSRKDIAELSGISPETVVRIMKKFKEDKLIEMKGKYFRILDYDRLKKISDHG
jgi:CRP/FNR family transcriptional regulator, polysaccharide utilization system transcription regulator